VFSGGPCRRTWVNRCGSVSFANLVRRLLGKGTLVTCVRWQARSDLVAPGFFYMTTWALASLAQAGSPEQDALPPLPAAAASPAEEALPPLPAAAASRTAGPGDGSIPLILTPPDEEARNVAQLPVPPSEVLFPDSFPEQLLERFATLRKKGDLPIKLGSWHWFHVNDHGPNRSGYGIPPVQRGTYFYYMLFDPEKALDDDGLFSKIGFHNELRWRDAGVFRSFFKTQVWTWEMYGWVDTKVGRFKGGQIWRRFGLDWDNSFWGNTAFYDGYKLNPDYGLSWEHIWNARDDFKIGSFV